MRCSLSVAASLVLAIANARAAGEKRPPSLDDDRQALLGAWEKPQGKGPKGEVEPSVRLQFMHFPKNGNFVVIVGVVKEIGGKLTSVSTNDHIRLEENDGKRFIVILDGKGGKDVCRVPYRLSGGKRLLDNDRAVVKGFLKGTRTVNLKGEWTRVKEPK